MKNPFFEIWKKLFFSPYFFTIALRRKRETNILGKSVFQADHVIPATYKKWVADPMLADYEGKTYLFYEAVSNNHGRIEVAEVLDDCTIANPTVILEDDCHYSYPFVFQWKNQWYMIPESSAAQEIRLYHAAAFPTKWELVTVLLHQQSVDTTVFEKDGSLFLLTYLLCPGSERVKPHAYMLTIDAEMSSVQPLLWEEYDELKCRGAGPVFQSAGKQIRPAQSNEEQQYGNSVLFYEIQAVQHVYEEKLIGTLEPKRVTAKNVWLDGLHTYTSSQRYEAIDIRCRKFDWLKTPRTIFHKLKKEKRGSEDLRRLKF